MATERLGDPNLDEAAQAFQRLEEARGGRPIMSDEDLAASGIRVPTPAERPAVEATPAEEDAQRAQDGAKPKEEPPSEPTPEPEEEPPPAAAEDAQPDRGGYYDQLNPDLIHPDTPMTYPGPGGVRMETTYGEMQRRASMAEDYTQKTQALADDRRALEEQRGQLSVEGQQALARANQLASTLEERLKRYEPDPAALAKLQAEDPGQYAAFILARQEDERVAQAARAEADAAERRRIEAEIPRQRDALMRMSPEFNQDFGDRYAQVRAWSTSAQGGGLSEQEWNGLYDARLIRILELAMLGDTGHQTARAQKARIQKKVAQLPKVRPGVLPEPGDAERESYDRAIGHLQETGRSGLQTTADIAAAFAAKETRRRAGG